MNMYILDGFKMSSKYVYLTFIKRQRSPFLTFYQPSRILAFLTLASTAFLKLSRIGSLDSLKTSRETIFIVGGMH